MLRWKFFPVILIALALCLMYAYNVATNFRQSAVWTGPYLSAAANLTWPVSFKIDVEEIERFNELDDTCREDRYQFKQSDNLTSYTYNDLGYVYLVWAARHVFPFLGDQQAIILLQALVHLLLCTFLISSTAFVKSWRVCFLVLYALNPLVLKYVVFNHYYFWQAVPSLLIVLLAQDTQKRAGGGVYFGLLFLPWAILARTTAVLGVPVVLYLLYRRSNLLSFSLTLVYCGLVWGFFYKPSQKNIWHTAYVGTGAYRNPYGVKLSDEDGFKLYQNTFGTRLSGTTGGNVYEPETYRRYRALGKKTVLSQLSETPFLYLKNALVNTSGAYGLGYVSGRPDAPNYLLALLGVVMVAFLVLSKQWIILISVGLLSVSFTPYYPPLPAYMYGNYALLATGLANGLLLIRKRGQKRILYLSFNDGSDMRVNKEMRTLSKAAPVELLALGSDSAQCFAAPFADRLVFVKGKRHAITTLIRYFAKSAGLLLFRRYESVHVINEPQLLALWPFLWLQERVVLDIFDSVFLKMNRSGNQWRTIKRWVYAPISRCIVTEENRLNLLPSFLQSKAIIVPNYPYRIKEPLPKNRNSNLTIMYYGWLGEHRGTETVRALMAADADLKVIMAGWLADVTSRELCEHPRVEWLGVLPQAEATAIAARCADYILCVYAPLNDNNINASPNKIYDAIQIKSPVIINAEVKASDFIVQNRLGYVMPSYRLENYDQMAVDLLKQRDSYRFDETLRQRFTWEQAETALLDAHELMKR